MNRNRSAAVLLAFLVTVPGAARSEPGSASGLVATAQSASSVSLLWSDPDAGETGFRVERSLDGSAWTPLLPAVGPNETTFLDPSLEPATLYYYRVVAFSGGGDAAPSNVAAATTFASVATNVCQTSLLPAYPKVSTVSVSAGPAGWVAAWARNTAVDGPDVYFQALGAASGTPAGAPVKVSRATLAANRPTVVWNGASFGLIWSEGAFVPDGTWRSRLFFALLEPGGQRVRGPMLVPPPGVATGMLGTTGGRYPLVWDGSGWGVFACDGARPPGDWTYFRLDADGDRVLGPVYLHATPEQEADLSAAWNGSEYGLAWAEYGTTTSRVVFQRMQQDGVLVGSPLELASKPVDVFLWGASIASHGDEWAVAWSVADSGDPQTDDSERVYLRRIDASGNPLGPAVRLSDAVDPEQPPGETWPVYDETPKLVARQDGGYGVFAQSLGGPQFNRWEVSYLRTDASGSKAGTRTFVSARDGLNSQDFCPASDGANALVAWTDPHLGPTEVADAIVSPTGGILAGPADITSGSSAASAVWSALAPVGEGFALLWVDSGTGPALIQAQIRDGSGAVIAEKRPLSARAVSGTPVAVGVGRTFTVVWREASSPAIYLCRYDAEGSPLIPETNVSALGGGGSSPVVAFSGEAYGVAWLSNQNVRFQAVGADGSLIGGQTTVVAGNAPAMMRISWIGSGWMILWRASWESKLYVAVVGAGGGTLVPATSITSGRTVSNALSSAWNGAGMGVVWADGRSDVYPDLYFTVLKRDGTKAFPEKPVVATPDFETSPFLYWTGSRFRLMYWASDRGLREVELLADGSLQGQERMVCNRGNPFVAASNGATVGLAYGTFFQTSECLVDATPPPCPPASAALDGLGVHLSWLPVSDPESTLIQYHVYRDGGILAETWPSTTSYDDTGMLSGHVHTYEVRAMNGAMLPSAGCAVYRFSSVCADVDADGAATEADVASLFEHLFAGGPAPLSSADANGDHVVDAADAFYLINRLLAGGPPPSC